MAQFKRYVNIIYIVIVIDEMPMLQEISISVKVLPVLIASFNFI